MTRSDRAVIGGIALGGIAILAGTWYMGRIYIHEHMYRNYGWRAPLDGRSLAIHLGILVTAAFGLGLLWSANRIRREVNQEARRKGARARKRK